MVFAEIHETSIEHLHSLLLMELSLISFPDCTNEIAQMKMQMPLSGEY